MWTLQSPFLPCDSKNNLPHAMDTKAWLMLLVLMLGLVLAGFIPAWTLLVAGVGWFVYMHSRSRTQSRADADREKEQIAHEAPELLDMGFTERNAYMLKAADEFALHASVEQRNELADATATARRVFEDQGKVMPSWLVFAMMRNAQRKFGLPINGEDTSSSVNRSHTDDA